MQEPTRIELEEGRRLRVSWPDGDVYELAAGELRSACACADCRSAAERPDRRRVAVLGDTPPSIQDVQLVGAYGLRLVFGPDGHRTGIFTWEQLRSLGEG